METSILKTVRTSLGILPDFTEFDAELIVAINSALMAVSQLGIGPDGGFSISDDTATWTELFNSVSNIEAVKSYVVLKTRLEFDPPGTSFLMDSFNRQLDELGFRLMVEVDPDFVPAE
jgi:hypothetical protein